MDGLIPYLFLVNILIIGVWGAFLLCVLRWLIPIMKRVQQWDNLTPEEKENFFSKKRFIIAVIAGMIALAVTTGGSAFFPQTNLTESPTNEREKRFREIEEYTPLPMPTLTPTPEATRKPEDEIRERFESLPDAEP